MKRRFTQSETARELSSAQENQGSNCVISAYSVAIFFAYKADIPLCLATADASNLLSVEMFLMLM